MAAPGTQFGPCEHVDGGTCSHIDCAQTRSDAASECPLCSQPIGYETAFYQFRWTSPGGVPFEALGHAVCVEDHYEKERKAAPAAP